MIVGKEDLIGADGEKYYANEPIYVKASFAQDTPYTGELFSMMLTLTITL